MVVKSTGIGEGRIGSQNEGLGCGWEDQLMVDELRWARVARWGIWPAGSVDSRLAVRMRRKALSLAWYRH